MLYEACCMHIGDKFMMIIFGEISCMDASWCTGFGPVYGVLWSGGMDLGARI